MFFIVSAGNETEMGTKNEVSVKVWQMYRWTQILGSAKNQ